MNKMRKSVSSMFPSGNKSVTLRSQVWRSMTSFHQLSFRHDCYNTAKSPSFTPRTDVWAMPSVSDRWCVDVQWFQERSWQAFPNFKGQCTWLQDFYRTPKIIVSSFVLFKKFLFCTKMLGSIECLSPAQRLHVDDCFEIHTCHWKPCDLLLSSHQIFSTRCGCVIAFSAWGPCIVGPFTHVAISDLKRLRKSLCLPKSSHFLKWALKTLHFLDTFKIVFVDQLAWVSSSRVDL